MRSTVIELPAAQALTQPNWSISVVMLTSPTTYVEEELYSLGRMAMWPFAIVISIRPGCAAISAVSLIWVRPTSAKWKVGLTPDDVVSRNPDAMSVTMAPVSAPPYPTVTTLVVIGAARIVRLILDCDHES